MNYLIVHVEKATGDVLVVESATEFHYKPSTSIGTPGGTELAVEVVFIEVDDPEFKPAKYYVDKLEADGQKKIKWKDIVGPGEKKTLKETKRESKGD